MGVKGTGIEWQIADGLVDYPQALATMESRVAAIRQGDAAEHIWLLEHPPLYTIGTSADPAELLDPRYPVYAAGRGGRYTYHGPGQRVGYVMLDLERRGKDVRAYVHALEGWVIAALARLDVKAFRAEGRIGIWVKTGDTESKIGAIGVRVRRWVTYHGFSINASPELGHFSGIIPCGISDYGVTSLTALANKATLADLDTALSATLPEFLAALGDQR